MFECLKLAIWFFCRLRFVPNSISRRRSGVRENHWSVQGIDGWPRLNPVWGKTFGTVSTTLQKAPAAAMKMLFKIIGSEMDAEAGLVWKPRALVVQPTNGRVLFEPNYDDLNMICYGCCCWYCNVNFIYFYWDCHICIYPNRNVCNLLFKEIL